MATTEKVERFQYFNSETNFSEKFKLFSVESTKIENAILSYKTTLSEANVKTNRMVGTKCTYDKKRSFASNYFIFWKILFQFKNLV